VACAARAPAAAAAAGRFSVPIRADRSGHALPLQDGQQLERIDGANIPKIKSCIVTKAPSNKG
jgi:hypothetical protein